jgi:hypothetical protein
VALVIYSNTKFFTVGNLKKDLNFVGTFDMLAVACAQQFAFTT